VPWFRTASIFCVRNLRQKTEAEDVEIVALRAVLLARSQGDFVSEQDVDGRITAMIDRKRRPARVDG